MSAAVLLLIANALVLGLLGLYARRTVRQLRGRLASLTRPLHELRGALTAIELGLALIERSSSSCADLNGCVDSLRLALERASLGARDADALRRGDQVSAVMDHLDVSALILRSARAWSLLAPAYNASLDVVWHAGPVRVLGHAGRLQQAFDNLIANALEHGGGRVLVEGEHRGAQVRVLVSDGGAGLPSQFDEASSNTVRGHGLKIASAVIREHEGRLALGMGRNGPGILVELPATGGGGNPPVVLRGEPSTARNLAPKAA
jgi:signal transduction histidine kinase